MKNLLFILPMSYFIKTRLNTLKLFVFHSYYEWIPAFLFLLYKIGDISTTIENFFLSYIAFICIYELGYIYNDFESIKNESSPRLRFRGADKIDSITIGIWVTIRIIIFLLITYHFNLYLSLKWILFYIVLFVSFLAHNLLKSKELKYVTFINLSFFRFLSPIFIFLDNNFLKEIIPLVLIYYSLYRGIGYLDSKSLLQSNNRKTKSFKLGFYIFLLPISLFLSSVFSNFIPLIMNLYFGFFWFFYPSRN